MNRGRGLGHNVTFKKHNDINTHKNVYKNSAKTRGATTKGTTPPEATHTKAPSVPGGSRHREPLVEADRGENTRTHPISPERMDQDSESHSDSENDSRLADAELSDPESVVEPEFIPPKPTIPDFIPPKPLIPKIIAPTPTLPEFITPNPLIPVRQQNKKRKNMATANETLETSNRFEALSDLEETPEFTVIKKPATPPPVIIKGKPADIKKQILDIEKHATKGFNIKFTRNNTNIYFKSESERLKYLEAIRIRNIEYYTYTNKTDKQHAFVLKGLETDLTVEEILAELKIINNKITKVYKMNTKIRPAYLVTATNDVNLTDISKIKVIHYTRVSWERHVNKKELIQCHRCQLWGHATSNCGMKARCLKCAGDHITSECVKSAELPAQCCNCKGLHPANSTSCPHYITRLAQLQARRANAARPADRQQAPAQTQYVPAPQPTVNAWAERAARRQAGPPASAYPPPGYAHHYAAQQQQIAQPRPALLPTPTASGAPQRTSTPINAAAQHATVQQAPQAPPRGGPTTTAPFPGAATSPDADVGSLFSEMQRLNSLVNLTELVRALRDFNNCICNCKSSFEILTKTLEFSQNMNHYNI